MRMFNPGVPPDPKLGYPKRPRGADGVPYVVVPSGYHNAGQKVPAPDGTAIVAMVGEAFYVIPPRTWGVFMDVAMGDEHQARRVASIKSMAPSLLSEEEFAEQAQSTSLPDASKTDKPAAPANGPPPKR